MSEGRFAGVDWASEEHAVCVVDEHGRIVEGRRYRHDERGLRALCARLLGVGVRLVAIERPDGLLIERPIGCGAVSDRGASQPGRCVAPAVPRCWWEERQLRQLRARRVGQDRQSPVPGPGTG